MAARYRILIADPLLGMGLVWPPGVSLAGRGEPGPSGTHYWLLDDPGAPPELEGREVELTLGRDGNGEPVIRERRPVLVHQVPPDGEAVMPCCARSPSEVPRGDRITADQVLLTCGRP